MIQLYYSTHHRNFGDALNPYLMERVLHIPFQYSAFKKASAAGVGSLLQKCTASKFALHRRFFRYICPELQVLSSGFIRMIPDDHVLVRRLNVKAVRGHKTRELIEKLTGKPCQVPVGDGGLLYSFLLDSLPAKKYEIGIIPHYRDHHQPVVKEVANHFPGSVIIDVLDEPLEVLKQIASCNYILSSSLHGLIVADALGIPNRHVHFSDNVAGNDFKFQDYISVFEPEYRLDPLNPDDVLKQSFSDLFDVYRSKMPQIEKLQQDLLKAMTI